jgi:hypothetical protein
MPNQYTKAEEEGKTKPKGANQFTTGKREKLDEATRDKIRAERAAQVAEQIMNDPESSKDQKLAACKVLLPYGKSTLQSIESRVTQTPPSEDEIQAQLHALLANPGVRAQIEAMLKGAPILVDGVGEAQQTPDPAHMSIANASK